MTPSAFGSRRSVLMGLGGLALSGCVSTPAALSMRPRFVVPALAPIDARPERITRVTVCLRPFRAAGPRIEVEPVGDKRVVHNYGHGGSGWSLSWGSAEIVRDLALAGGARSVAVIGCGALGLTAATLLLRAGAEVTIYAAERLPQTRSARATGVWSPDSRIADADRVDAAFPNLWERMARASWAMHQTYVGQPAEPVAFVDQYSLSDRPRSSTPSAPRPPAPGRIRFAEYGSRLRDLTTRSVALDASGHPFDSPYVRRAANMQFNIAELGRRLMADFLMEGGRIETRTFHAPGELTALPQPVVVNCTGYGARALFGDDSIVPVRGQMTWLPPQPEVHYSLYYSGVGVTTRPDGIGVQRLDGDMMGYGLTEETPDRAEAEDAVARVAALFKPAA
ncbi:MAG: FAD-binding oxidoreductase [Alphaproteobacteria bacterium]|nr:FAD-binding oxidoreductase [Alphaproteobacteria bacterium]MBU2378470.1 FAD-binding oxidoreductase [Alphaproteobacteria bacterium]